MTGAVSSLDDVRALYDFQGRTAVVTGGTGVLGGEMARALAACNASVVLLGRNRPRAEEVIAGFPPGGQGRHLALAADVLDRPALEEACRQVVAARGQIDILVNGAGGNQPAATTGPGAPFFDVPLEAWQAVTNLNLLAEADARALCAQELARWSLRGRRVLAVVPDQTRTAPIDLMFRVLHDEARAAGARAFDVLIALGTHPPLSDEAINRRLGLTPEDRAGKYAATRADNHRWDDPAALVSIGTIGEDEVAALSGGRMRERVDVTINRRALAYDLLLIIGPTFPHEVVGFSGGNKYLFPGIGGPGILELFHWLGALITSPALIGTKHTPVRAVIDRAAALVPVERRCASLVVEGTAPAGLAGLYLGAPEETWEAAATLSGQIHVITADRPYRSVLSCAPPMYQELWVGSKCAYKLEPVVADGGEIIIHAPHIHEISAVHGRLIREIGYHVRDYFVKQPGRFDGVPRAVRAHSTHVKGLGTFEGGVERPRIAVTLATAIPEAACRAVNLGYRDFRTIDVAAWQGREAEGLLHVPRAGETLYRLAQDPFATG